MAPAVAPGSQMRRPPATIRRQRSGNFGDLQPAERSFDDHLAREFHSGGLQIDPLNRAAIEAAQAAMKIADRGAKEQAAKLRQHRVAQVAVQERHGAGLDSPPKAISHHEIGAIAQFGHELFDSSKIVAAVGITHNDMATASRADAAQKRTAITLALNVH